MKVKFTRKRQTLYLVLGIVFIALGTFSIIIDDEIRWSSYGHFVIGVVYIGLYLDFFTNQYLIIENGTIKKNGLYGFGKEMNFNEINWIKKSAGVYTLKTEKRELKIHTEFIDKDSLIELDKILAELNLPDEKTPFAYRADSNGAHIA